MATLYLVLGMGEYFFPAETNQSRKGRLRNIVLTGIFYFGGFACLALIYPYIPLQTKQVSGGGVLFSTLLIVASIFLTDFIFYWYHRAQHAFPFLWAIHELHHSDNELNVTTSMRTYFLERPLQALLISLPVGYIVGITNTVLLLLPVLLLFWLFFTHTNIRLQLGWLSRIICGPQVHRIHHSALPEHQNKNFAQFLPILDIIFGTYYPPKKGEFPPTGVVSMVSMAPIKIILIKPFVTWWNILKDASA